MALAASGSVHKCNPNGYMNMGYEKRSAHRDTPVLVVQTNLFGGFRAQKTQALCVHTCGSG